MKKHNWIKKLITIFVCVFLMLAALPAYANAEEDETVSDEQVIETIEEESQEEDDEIPSENDPTDEEQAEEDVFAEPTIEEEEGTDDSSELEDSPAEDESSETEDQPSETEGEETINDGTDDSSETDEEELPKEEEPYQEAPDLENSTIIEKGIDYTLYDNGDGTNTLFSYIGAIRYENEENELVDIDLELKESEDGYSPASTKADILFPETVSEDSPITVTYEDHTLEMLPLFVSDKGNDAKELKADRDCLEENTIIYRDEKVSSAYYRYYAGNDGIKEEIVLEEIPGSNVFRFSVRMKEASFKLEDNGDVAIYDSSNQIIAYIGVPCIIDSKGEYFEDPVRYETEETEDPERIILDLVVDEQYLQTADYPLAIDPTEWFVNYTQVFDVYVRSANPNTNYYLNSYKTMQFGHSGSNTSRTYIYFDGLQNFISGKAITWAVFDAFLKTVPTNLPVLEIRRIKSTWNPSTITWSNQPSYSGEVYSSQWCGTNTATPHEFNILNLVRLWADGSKANYGIMIKSDDETDNYNTFGEFYGSRNTTYEDRKPYIGVTYVTSIPAPANVSITKKNEVLNSGHADIDVSFKKVNDATGYKIKFNCTGGTPEYRDITNEITVNGNTCTWSSEGKNIFSGYEGLPNDASVALGGTSNVYKISVGAINAGVSSYSSAQQVTFKDTTPPAKISNISESYSAGQNGQDMTVSFKEVKDLPDHGACGVDYYLVGVYDSSGVLLTNEIEVDAQGTGAVTSCVFEDIDCYSNVHIGIKSYDNNGNYAADMSISSVFSVSDVIAPNRPTVLIDPFTWSNAASFEMSWSDATDNMDSRTDIVYSLSDESNFSQEGAFYNSGPDGSGTISLSGAPDGILTLTVTARDDDNNFSESTAVSYFRDTAAPLISILSPLDNGTFSDVLILDGSITDGLSGSGSGIASWTVSCTGPGLSEPLTVASGTEEASDRILAADVSDLTDNQVYTFTITAADHAQNTSTTVLTLTKTDSDIVMPDFDILRQYSSGVWYLSNLVNPITLTGTVPQGTKTLVADGRKQPLDSQIALADLADDSDGSRHFPYVRIVSGSDVCYSAPSYEVSDSISDIGSDPGIAYARIPLSHIADAFSVSLNASPGSVSAIYISDLKGDFIEIQENTRYFLSDLYYGNSQTVYQGDTGFVSDLDCDANDLALLIVLDPLAPGDPIASISYDVTQVIDLTDSYFTVRTVGVPSQLTATENVNYSVLLRWNPVQNCGCDVFRAPFNTGQYQLIAEDLTEAYFYDYNVEYATAFSYYVVAKTTVNNVPRSSSPSERVHARFVDENEIYKHLGLEDSYECQSFSDGYGQGYVELYDGNLVYVRSDAEVYSGLFSLNARRTYNSNSKAKTVLGYGWDLSFNTALLKEYDNGTEQAILLKDGDGSIHRFAKQNGAYVTPAEETLKLIHHPEDLQEHTDAFYEVRRDDGISYIFNEDLQLEKMKSRSGDELSFTYSSRGNIIRVTNSSGIYLQFVYDSLSSNPDLVSKLELPDGTYLKYCYLDDRLVTVKKKYDGENSSSVEIATETYAYEDGRLARVTVPSAASGSYTEFDYDENRAARIDFPQGRSLHFAYDGPERRIEEHEGNDVFSASRIYYDENAHALIKIDPSGNAVYYSYDNAGNVTRIGFSNPCYNETGTFRYKNVYYEFEYDADHNLIHVTDAKERQRWYAYDDANDPFLMTMSTIQQSGTVNMITEYTYDAATGNLTQMTDAELRESSYTYVQGKEYLLASSTDEYGTVTSYTYDVFGRLTGTSIRLKTEAGNEEYITSSVVGYDSMGRCLGTVDPNGNRTIYTYDRNGNIVQEVHDSTDPDSDSMSTSYSYYANGLLAAKTEYGRNNAASRHTEYCYDALNRLIDVYVEHSSSSYGHHTHYDYSYGQENGIAYLQVAQSEQDSQDSDAIVSSICRYNARGELIYEEKDGNISRISYDAAGNIIDITNRNGVKVLYAYNTALKLLRKIIVGNDGTSKITISTGYDYVGNLVRETDGEGNLKYYTYDKLNRLTSVTEGPEGNTTVTTYSYGSTAVNDLIVNTVTAPGGMVTSTYLDRAGRTAMVEDSGMVGNTLKKIRNLYEYDAGSRLTKLTKDDMDPLHDDEIEIAYSYDIFGNVVREDRNSSHTIYQYDAFNRLYHFADYDSSNEPIPGTDVRYSYDILDRAIQYNQDGENVNYVYRADGKLADLYYEDHDNTGVQTGDITHITYLYNQHNEMTHIKLGKNNVTPSTVAAFRYDENGLMYKRITYRNFVDEEAYKTYANYSYDVFGRTVDIRYRENGSDRERYQYAYDGNSNILTETVSNSYLSKNYVNTYAYDALGRLTSVTQTGDYTGTASYTYDAAGNRTSMTRDSLATSYTYNGLNQLVSSVEQIDSNRSHDITTTYAYDAFGNLHQSAESNRKSNIFTGVPAAYNASCPDAVAFYKASGNFTLNTTVTYNYDDRNRLTSSPLTYEVSGTPSGYLDASGLQHALNGISFSNEEMTGIRDSYLYNANDQRTRRVSSHPYYETDNNITEVHYSDVITKYYYTGDSVLFTADTSNNKLTENILDLSGNTVMSKRFEANSSGWYTFNSDIRGSVTSILRANGTSALNYVYDEYGNIISRSNDSFLNDASYTGAVFDEDTSLYYLNARYYDPSLGIFLSRDTYRGDVYSSATHNLYSYTGNNPISFVDPTGHYSIPIACNDGGGYATTPQVVIDQETGKMTIVPNIQEEVPSLPAYDIGKSLYDYYAMDNDLHIPMLGDFNWHSIATQGMSIVKKINKEINCSAPVWMNNLSTIASCLTSGVISYIRNGDIVDAIATAGVSYFCGRVGGAVFSASMGLLVGSVSAVSLPVAVAAFSVSFVFSLSANYYTGKLLQPIKNWTVKCIHEFVRKEEFDVQPAY